MIPSTYQNKPLIYVWEYQNATGETLGLVGRYDDGKSRKDIVPYFKLNGSGFHAGIDMEPRPLFGLDKLSRHPKNKAVFIVEGERCAAVIQSLGLCSVTSLGGSKAANLTDWKPLEGYQNIVILPDNDEPGVTSTDGMFTGRCKPWKAHQRFRFCSS